MTITSSPLSDLIRVLQQAGATRVYAKPLRENDNSKQQLYLGKSLEALSILPYGDVIACPALKEPNFKAKLEFYWLGKNGSLHRAPHAQLIFYPGYPEARLSGFLRDCAAAPSNAMQPIPRSFRNGKGDWDGRVLIIGITADDKIIGALATASTQISSEFSALMQTDALTSSGGVLYSLPVITQNIAVDEKLLLLQELSKIINKGKIASCRLFSDGSRRTYTAQNGAGYTLEAELGIIPNGRSEPDYLGWEVKACREGRITLMTPEPDIGFYGENGVAAFLRKYGRVVPNDTLYFTGQHAIGNRNTVTGQLLELDGFDVTTSCITKVDGGITLTDSNGNLAAGWSFAKLIEHWGRKHANTAYVKYERHTEPDDVFYSYLSPIYLGTGTDFTKFLYSMSTGHIVYDPGPKLSNFSTSPRAKARSQFRTAWRKLPLLYDNFDAINL